MDVHGGNIYRYQREGRKVLDYSANINPLGLPKNFMACLAERVEELEHYPDPEYISLRKAIAKHEGRKLEEVIVGNGATEVLFLYMKTLLPKKALLLAPCFAEYQRALEAVDCEIHFLGMEEGEEAFSLPMEGIEKELREGDYDLLLLCNPNNPTSHFVERGELEGLLKMVEEKDLHFFVDEAFLDFLPNYQEKTAMQLDSERIFVLRAFTKFFAMPGLRLGYGMTKDVDFLEKMWQKKEPWSVNQVAVIAGEVFLEEEEYILETRRALAEEKARFYTKLKEIEGLKVFRPTVNFLLCKLEEKKVEEVKAALLEEGILVRDARNFPSLEGEYLRFAIKDRERNEKLEAALAKVMKEEER